MRSAGVSASANMSAMLRYIITNENIPQALADWMRSNGLGMM